jgi:hypothetical protein
MPQTAAHRQNDALKIANIDSQRMVLHVVNGKGERIGICL